MSTGIVSRRSLPTGDPASADALAVAITHQREHILKLERTVIEARDRLVRAGAELDAVVRERDGAVFRLLHLNDQLEDLAVPVK